MLPLYLVFSVSHYYVHSGAYWAGNNIYSLNQYFKESSTEVPENLPPEGVVQLGLFSISF